MNRTVRMGGAKVRLRARGRRPHSGLRRVFGDCHYQEPVLLRVDSQKFADIASQMPGVGLPAKPPRAV